MKCFVIGSDGKFHECKILGECYSYLHLFPLIYVQAVKGYPFNDSQFAQVEKRQTQFLPDMGNQTLPDVKVRKTAGL